MSSKPKLLITGAAGFIGRQLSIQADRCGYEVLAVSRSFSDFEQQIKYVSVGDVDGNTDWLELLKGCDTVIHLAARVHVMDEFASDALAEFRKVNVEGTLNLARQAAFAQIRRFIFISSIGVNGAETSGTPFRSLDKQAPHSYYAISKSEAEQGLQKLSGETGMEVVIIRPPLVYGPNAPGSFGSLVRLVSRGVPLPLGAVTQNRRSLVGLDNLVDLILTCVDHHKAANQTFLVSDGEDLSTTGLLQKISKAMNRSVCLLPVSVDILIFVATLLGKKTVVKRLVGSLQVDISKTCELLDWKPSVSVDEGLRRALGQRV